MANHVLSIEAPDTMNKCILRLVDTSVYNEDRAVTCPRLQVTPPGFSESKDISGTQPGFMLNLTACDLGIQSSQCGTTFYDLSDGIYILKWSVSPNTVIYAEYNHLRITNALNKIQAILCDLDLAACAPPAKTTDKLNELNTIRMMLLGAKAKVEDCHEPRHGMDIYNYALRLLEKLDCSRCV